MKSRNLQSVILTWEQVCEVHRLADGLDVAILQGPDVTSVQVYEADGGTFRTWVLKERFA